MPLRPTRRTRRRTSSRPRRSTRGLQESARDLKGALALMDAPSGRRCLPTQGRSVAKRRTARRRFKRADSLLGTDCRRWSTALLRCAPPCRSSTPAPTGVNAKHVLACSRLLEGGVQPSQVNDGASSAVSGANQLDDGRRSLTMASSSQERCRSAGFRHAKRQGRFCADRFRRRAVGGQRYARFGSDRRSGRLRRVIHRPRRRREDRRRADENIDGKSGGDERSRRACERGTTPP